MSTRPIDSMKAIDAYVIAIEKVINLQNENDELKEERDALKAVISDPQKWMRWCDSRVLEENESLKEENARLKAHIKDLGADLNGTIKECNDWHVDGRTA